MTKSAKIRRLLNLKMKPKAVAKKLKVDVNLVYQVGWAMRKAKKKPSKIIKAVKEVKQALDKIEVGTNIGGLTLRKLSDNKYTWRKETSDELVNKPSHYTGGGIDFLDYAEAKGLTENAYLFNVVKYVSRAGKKVGADPVQDLEKAEFYLKREIARRKSA